MLVTVWEHSFVVHITIRPIKRIWSQLSQLYLRILPRRLLDLGVGRAVHRRQSLLLMLRTLHLIINDLLKCSHGIIFRMMKPKNTIRRRWHLMLSTCYSTSCYLEALHCIIIINQLIDWAPDLRQFSLNITSVSEFNFLLQEISLLSQPELLSRWIYLLKISGFMIILLLVNDCVLRSETRDVYLWLVLRWQMMIQLRIQVIGSERHMPPF